MLDNTHWGPLKYSQDTCGDAKDIGGMGDNGSRYSSQRLWYAISSNISSGMPRESPWSVYPLLEAIKVGCISFQKINSKGVCTMTWQ